MIIGTIRRILLEDLAKGGGDPPPPWAKNLLYPLNQFLEQVTSALRNRLTFEDNFSCVVKTVNVVHDIWKEISVGSTLKVDAVIPLDASGVIINGFGFDRLANGNIRVKVQLSGGGTTNTNAKFLILLE